MGDVRGRGVTEQKIRNRAPRGCAVEAVESRAIRPASRVIAGVVAKTEAHAEIVGAPIDCQAVRNFPRGRGGEDRNVIGATDRGDAVGKLNVGKRGIRGPWRNTLDSKSLNGVAGWVSDVVGLRFQPSHPELIHQIGAEHMGVVPRHVARLLHLV